MINVCPGRMSVDRATVIQVGPRNPGAPEGRDELLAYVRKSMADGHTLEDLGMVLRDFVALVGYDNFNVAVYAPGANADQTLFIFNGYDPEWWKIYYERQYVDVDPIMATSMLRCAPYEWHEIDFSKVPQKAMELYMEAARFKIFGGYSTRVLGPYGFQLFASFSTEKPGKTLGPRRDEVFSTTLLFLAEFIDACLRVISQNPGLVSLTERQLQALQLSADGMPHKAIAAHLGVVERTIDHHIKETQRKLRRKTRSSAIALATQMGLIIRDIPLRTIIADGVEVETEEEKAE